MKGKNQRAAQLENPWNMKIIHFYFLKHFFCGPFITQHLKDEFLSSNIFPTFVLLNQTN